jgi:hypothetical protein
MDGIALPAGMLPEEHLRRPHYRPTMDDPGLSFRRCSSGYSISTSAAPVDRWSQGEFPAGKPGESPAEAPAAPIQEPPSPAWTWRDMPALQPIRFAVPAEVEHVDGGQLQYRIAGPSPGSPGYPFSGIWQYDPFSGRPCKDPLTWGEASGHCSAWTRLGRVERVPGCLSARDFPCDPLEYGFERLTAAERELGRLPGSGRSGYCAGTEWMMGAWVHGGGGCQPSAGYLCAQQSIHCV